MPNVTQDDVSAFLHGKLSQEMVAGLSVKHLRSVCKYLKIQSNTSLSKEDLVSVVT